MNRIVRVGVDLAKNVMQLHGVDVAERVVIRKAVTREKFLEWFANLAPCVVAMEACTASHFWARRLREYGHDVRLIPPQFAAPYRKGGSSVKNDAVDAEAICEAASRPHMRYVPVKTPAQQGALVLHRMRQGLIEERTALVNRLRGLVAEFGIFLPQGIHRFRTFSDASYGFRPGRSAHQAVERAQSYIQSGYRWVVDLDLEKFFDRVAHDVLMSRVAKRVSDRRVLKLIRSFLTAGVMEHGIVGATDEGTPQGGPLSPLLSNLMLDDLDRELERRGLRFVRYADDCNVYVRSERAGQRVMEGLKTFLASKLKLKVNDAKSAVARPHTRQFLGFSFAGEEEVKRCVAPKALTRLKDRVRELTGRRRGVSADQMLLELKRYLIGWRGYFGFCERRAVLYELDKWIRHRVRCYFWTQWKTTQNRVRELLARGVSREWALTCVSRTRGPWHVSHGVAVSRAIGNRYLASRGLPSLSAKT